MFGRTNIRPVKNGLKGRRLGTVTDFGVVTLGKLFFVAVWFLMLLL